MKTGKGKEGKQDYEGKEEDRENIREREGEEYTKERGRRGGSKREDAVGRRVKRGKRKYYERGER